MNRDRKNEADHMGSKRKNEGGKKRESKKGQGELLPSTSYISTTPHNKLQFTSVESASTCVLRAEVHSNKSLRSKIPTDGTEQEKEAPPELPGLNRRCIVKGFGVLFG
jgi:hypothetical protein